MKKKLIIFFIFFIFLSLNNHLFAKNKSEKKISGCNFLTINYNSYDDFDNLIIKNIDVEIKNYRKWSINNIKILTNGSRIITDKYKSRFDAIVIVKYQNDLECYFEAQVRQSGDEKDHITLENNSVIQSLDVELKDGNIKGITKFKLFKKNVRGNIEDEIFQSHLLRLLGYLAPRSAVIQAKINGNNTQMLFQEKATKELLEYNGRREGPILEGDEKYFWKLIEDIPQNNLSNWSLGTPFLMNKTIKGMLSKSINAQITERSESHKEIVLEAINNLNLIYLYWSNRFQDNYNNYFFFDYDLDNELLGFLNKNNTIKLDVYNLLMQSTNSHHGLSVSNRKFYWNSFENYFEPINYDSNVDIELELPTTTNAVFRLPISQYYEESFKKLENSLKNININELKNNLVLSGINISEDEIKEKLNKILLNFEKIKSIYQQNVELIKKNIFNKEFFLLNNSDILNNFKNTLRDIDPNAKLITINKKDNTIRCDIYFNNCTNFVISKNELSKLLQGDLQIKNTNYQFIGTNVSLDNFYKKDELKSIDIGSSKIFYEDGIEVIFDNINKILIFNQRVIGARAFIINGSLENIKVIFNGIDIYEENKFDLKSFPKNFPINKKNLTGCLSFINLELLNITINAKNSNCEDAINFVNAKGTVKNLDIVNSFSDAIDADFSNIYFKDVFVDTAFNDCVDVSSGKYIFDNIIATNCGDKGISVGEKSNVNINKIEVKNSNMGIASKDSSQVYARKNFFSNVKTCFSAYKKKQEFYGAYINIVGGKCVNYYKDYDLDKY